VFGPDNHLWVTTGDAATKADAQDPSRSREGAPRPGDGRPGRDNPRHDGWDDRVYTLGHRNPQCITWLPDATPVVTEHGPNGLDEVSVLEAGGNYGWPDVRRPEGYRANPEMSRPALNTGLENSWAPTGRTFYTGDAVPSWRNCLVFGQLIAQRVGVVSLTPDGETRPRPGTASASRATGWTPTSARRPGRRSARSGGCAAWSRDRTGRSTRRRRTGTVARRRVSEEGRRPARSHRRPVGRGTGGRLLGVDVAADSVHETAAALALVGVVAEGGEAVAERLELYFGGVLGGRVREVVDAVGVVDGAVALQECERERRVHRGH